MLPFFRAHVMLSTCRTVNGDIPWTAIDDYARRHPEFDDFPFFEDVIYGFERIKATIVHMTKEAGSDDARH